MVSPKWGTLVALRLEGHWCPQHGGRWWHWGWRDIGVPNMGVSVGLGLEVTLVALGLEVVLVALGLKGHQRPQNGGRWWHWG